MILHRLMYAVAMYLTDFCVRQKILHTMTPERNDHLGINDFKLSKQIRPKGFLFRGERIAVVWWSVLYDISDVHIRTLHARLREHLIQELPRRTDKRLTL
ncbi:hypothetical protein D3C86_1753140 [compost metagenome]